MEMSIEFVNFRYQKVEFYKDETPPIESNLLVDTFTCIKLSEY